MLGEEFRSESIPYPESVSALYVLLRLRTSDSSSRVIQRDLTSEMSLRNRTTLATLTMFIG